MIAWTVDHQQPQLKMHDHDLAPMNRHDRRISLIDPARQRKRPAFPIMAAKAFSAISGDVIARAQFGAPQDLRSRRSPDGL